MNHEKKPPSKQSQIILESLQQAVETALEKKQKLGQYAVIWDGVKPIAVGEDAPCDLK